MSSTIISFKVRREEKDLLRKIARHYNMSLGEFVKRAIYHYLRTHYVVLPEDLKEQVLKLLIKRGAL